MFWGITAYLNKRNRTGRQEGLLFHLHLDFPLLLALAGMAFFSLVVLYSASQQDLGLVLGQCIRLMLAFSVMIIMAQIPPSHYAYWSPWLYGIGLVLLLLVLVTSFGASGGGAKRWLGVGSFRFQPSEIMKLSVPMLVAWYYSHKHLPPRITHVFIGLVIILIPVGLIAKQPDLGTALLVASAGLLVIYFAGLRWRHILFAIIAAIPMGIVLWVYGMKPYQKERVTTFIKSMTNPETVDKLGSGYQVEQSIIAIGSGSLTGKGYMNGTQSQLNFLPEQKTDFIFAVIAEEFGLIGAILLLLAYLYIISRGLYIATQAQDTYSRLLAGSLSITFLIYLVVNVGMVQKLLPVVGVPLPLISYGGTSAVTLMAGFGILMSIHTHRKLIAN